MSDDEDFPPPGAYGPMTKEETITNIKERRSDLYDSIMNLYTTGPNLTGPRFWAGYAKVLELWVEESQCRGFFRSERENNENGVEGWMGVPSEEGTTAAAAGSVLGFGEAGGAGAEKSREELLKLEDLRWRWTWLALECLTMARRVLPRFVDHWHGAFRSRVLNRPEKRIRKRDINHMHAMLNTKNTLFMAEQARYGDLEARKELVSALLDRGDCRFGEKFVFVYGVARFNAETIAKYDFLSQRMHRPLGRASALCLARYNYWCPVLQNEDYMIRNAQLERSAFHIVPRDLGMRGWVLAFGEPGHFLWWPSNGLFVDHQVGMCFQSMDFVVVPSGGPDSDALEIHVLNGAKLEHGWGACESERLNGILVQGRKLMFRNKERPAKKALYFHWLLAVLYWKAKGRNVEHAETELARHDEIWGTGRQYVRQELLEAIRREIGFDILVTNAIPSGTVSVTNMARLMTNAYFNHQMEIYHPLDVDSDGEFDDNRLAGRTGELAKNICKGRVFDESEHYAILRGSRWG